MRGSLVLNIGLSHVCNILSSHGVLLVRAVAGFGASRIELFNCLFWFQTTGAAVSVFGLGRFSGMMDHVRAFNRYVRLVDGSVHKMVASFSSLLALGSLAGSEGVSSSVDAPNAPRATGSTSKLAEALVPPSREVL